MTDARHMARLRDLEERLKHQAFLVRNSSGNMNAERLAGSLLDEANAIRWALRRINPETECVSRTLKEMAGES